MSEKRQSASPSAIQVKNRRKSISNEVKLDVISRLDKGELIAGICRNVRLVHSSVHTNRDNVMAHLHVCLLRKVGCVLMFVLK